MSGNWKDETDTTHKVFPCCKNVSYKPTRNRRGVMARTLTEHSGDWYEVHTTMSCQHCKKSGKKYIPPVTSSHPATTILHLYQGFTCEVIDQCFAGLLNIFQYIFDLSKESGTVNSCRW